VAIGVIHFSIRNPLIVNLMLGLVVVGGIFSWMAMPQEMFPLVELDRVRIVTEFEGAPPEEVERQVTILIEEELEGLPDIETITSTSSEGFSQIDIELKSGADVDNFIRDAETALDQITDLPDESEPPELMRLETRFPVISMAVYGDVEPGYLYELAEDVKRRLLKLPGVASVGVAGDREWEVWVTVDPQVLAARNVSLSEVTSALRENLRDLPGGSLKATEGDILLRGIGTAPDVAGMRSVVLRANPNGGQLLLGDVAHVEFRLEEEETLGRFNGERSVNLTVNKTTEASTIEVSDRVRELAADLRDEIPAAVNVGLFSDLSVYVRNRLDTVKSSGVIGLLLVLASLYLFLNFRVAAITALGIPVSFLVAVILINYLGFSINMVSLFAFLIALGMIVDDAIIVTENTYRHMENGMPAAAAAERGAREVYWPVVASTTTTVAAFLPMFAISGTMGEFIKVIPIVVTAALIGSLIEAFLVLPSHASEMLKVEKRQRRSRVDWKKWLDRYTRVVSWSVVNRYFVATLTVAVLLVMIVFAATRLPFQLFGHVSVGQFFVNIEAPNTYSVEDSAELAARIEQAIQETLADNELDTMLTNVGITMIDFNRIKFGSHYIQLIVDLKPRKPQGFIERFVSPVVNLSFSWEGERERAAEAIINDVRDRLTQIPGIQRLSILRPQGGPAGADIEVGVTGPDVARLLAIATELAEHVDRIPGTRDVRQDLEAGKLEYQYTLNARGKELGLTQAQLADAVRTGFLGLEVTHVTWGDTRYPVRVIYPDSVRESSAGLARLPITLVDGRTVFLGEVAELRLDRGLSTIHRRDLQRLATVTAEVDNQVATPLEVTQRITRDFADLSERYPGYELLFLGEKKEASDSVADMQRAVAIALLIIFFILAALFKSLLDPLVVMFAIPFGIIGVIFGHMLFGHHLQFLSLIGFLALTGIVVNDSLILVEFAKRLRAEGMDRFEAMVQAGRVRIRPILLTSITTFLGVSPLIFFASGQTAFLSPMAVSLGFGLLFATVLILVVLPCFYLIADDVRGYVCGHWRRVKPDAACTREG
jgi:multidrug efflux pump subunit AcrB